MIQNKLIPKNQFGNILKIDWEGMKNSLNSWFLNNINNINNTVTPRETVNNPTNRPNIPLNPATRVRGNIKAAYNGTKLYK